MPNKAGSAQRSVPGTRPLNSGTVLAFDFGERRIGVAVGALELGIAHPLETIEAAANDARFARIEMLVREWKPALMVVGLPLAMDGAEHRMTGLARKFAQRLRGRFGVHTRLVDERLTSIEAQRTLRETGQKSRDAKRRVDQLAAKLILEAYFNDSHGSA
jgi:putative Holliday junction resolvase